MAIAHVQNPSTYAKSTAATSLVLSFDSEPAAGNSVIVTAIQWSSGTKGIDVPTDNQSNTYVEDLEASDSGNQRMSFSRSHGIATGTPFTVTQGFASSSYCTLMVLEYSGAANEGAEATNENTGTSSDPSTGSISPTSTSLVIANVTHESGEATIAPDGGWTERAETEAVDDGQPSNIIDELSPAASENAGWTFNQSITWLAAIAAYKVAEPKVIGKFVTMIN